METCGGILAATALRPPRLVAYIDLIGDIHGSTPRDYLMRVTEHDKAACAAVAKCYDREYFDGGREHGYGGYRYDGRWRPFARALVDRYGLKPGDRVLDVGCAKGFLVHDLVEEVSGLEVRGVDISAYAIDHALESVRDRVSIADAISLPFAADSFDLVVAINVLHNLRLPELDRALREVERVGLGRAYIVVDGYRTEREKVNLFYWQLTCECFFAPDEWQWVFDRAGYTGDFACVYFE